MSLRDKRKQVPPGIGLVPEPVNQDNREGFVH
jgi:hypothetical protein